MFLPEEMMNMLRSLISRRTLACILASLVLILFATYSWFAVPIEIMPRENTPPYLMVRVNSGATQNTDLLELTLTKPVEGALKTVSKVLTINSTTDSRGVSVSLSLKPSTDLDIASLQIMEALEPLAENNVIDISQLSITRLNPDAIAVVKLSLALIPSKTLDLLKLKEEFKIVFESIPGVAKTEVVGMEPSVMEASISPHTLRKYSFSPMDITRLINIRPIMEYAGPLKTNQSTLPVFFNLQIPDVTTLINKPLTIENPVSIESLAKIKLIKKQDNEILRQNGNTTFLIEIFPKDAANLFQLNKSLLEAVNKLKHGPFGESIQIDTIFNLTNDLDSTIKEVFESLFEAMIITFIVVLLFYRSLMQTVLINVAIPISLLLTVLFLYLSGKSLNILTLSGLILGIGMVVDNAALVLSRIEELRYSLHIKTAAGQAAKDVSAALILSSITNALIFAPIAFIEGGDSFIDLLRAFQMPILGSIVAALIVALLILPIIRIYWRTPEHETLQREIRVQKKNEDHEVFIPLFVRIHKYRVPLAAVSLLIFLFCLDRVVKMDSADLETPRDPYITSFVKFSPEISADTRKDTFTQIEQQFLKSKNMLSYRLLLSEFNPNNTTGTLTFYPNDSEDKDNELVKLEDRLKKESEKISPRPGLTLSIGYSSYSSATRASKFDIALTGVSQRFAESHIQKIKDHLSGTRGLNDIQMEKDEKATKQLILIPKYELLNRYGITINQITSTLSSYLNPITVDQLKMNGESTVLQVLIPPEDKSWTLPGIMNLSIKTYNGLIRISDLVNIKFENTTNNIQRKEQKSIVKLIASADTNVRPLSETRKDVLSKLNSFSFPPGLSIEVDDSYLRILEMQKKSKFVIVLSIFLIYLVLASMFESLFIPIAIIFSIPLALVFGAGGLSLIGQPLDVMARLGLVILVGVGVNSAIILIDLIVNLREQGYRRREAIYIGCAKRLKTVLMTTTIQVLSVIPVAMGKAKLMGIPYSSLGIVIISGMIFSTIVTLILLPIIYEICDQLDVKFKRS